MNVDDLRPMTQSIIIADNYPVFRAGMARFLAVEDEFRIVGQCDDLPRLYKAVETWNGAIAIFAASLEPSLTELVQRAQTSKVRFVAVLDKTDRPEPYLRYNVDGILYRNASRAEILECLRSVARCGKHVQPPQKIAMAQLESDMIGERARNRLSRKELQIIGLLVQGYKNREIAEELHNTEQVIKNYLRSIFDKTGVSDRLELALFTLHHRILLDAVSRPGRIKSLDMNDPA